MSNATERSYFSGRAQTARRLAVRAKDPAVTAIHRTMAERYEGLATAPAARPTLRLRGNAGGGWR